VAQVIKYQSLHHTFEYHLNGKLNRSIPQPNLNFFGSEDKSPDFPPLSV